MSTELLVIAGPGVVVRRGDAVLWAESSDLRRESALAAIIAAMAETAAGRRTATDFTSWLIAELANPRAASVAALAFAWREGGELLTVVHGWGRVTAPGGAVTATGSALRIPATLPVAVGRADLAVLASGDSLLGLVDGSVPGGAALLLSRQGLPASPAAASPAAASSASASSASASSASASSASAAPAAPAQAAPVQVAPARPAPAASPASAAARPASPAPAPSPSASPAPPVVSAPPAAPSGTNSVLISLQGVSAADLPRREPLPVAPRRASTGQAPAEPASTPEAPSGPLVPSSPRAAIVQGVRCSRQHFNNPGALHCRVCGIAMMQQTQAQVEGERPPLGVLVCDDGATYGLDGDYAIGSDPRGEPGVTSGLAEPLVIGEVADGVAPTHIVIHLDGWDVHALNRSPGSPAAVLNRGDTQWTPLPPGQWARLTPGSYVGFAGRHVVYESNNRA